MTFALTKNPLLAGIRASVQNSYTELQQLLENQIAALPSAKLYQAPAENEWSLMQILAHIAEIMPYWAGEIEKLVAQPGQKFGRVMSDAKRLQAIVDHGSDTLAQAQTAFPPAYARLVQVLNNLKDSDLALVGVHSKFGEHNLEWFVDEFVTTHLINHLNQLKECLRVVA